MKKTTMVLLAVGTLFGLNGCGNDTPSSSSAKAYSKTPAEVYAQSCVKCHGKNAEGLTEKKAPALNDRQAGELELDLYDVKNGGTNQSSGTDHDIMEHNMQKLLDKGYDYDPKAMAEYIEKSFYKLPPKTAPAAEKAPAPEAKAPAAEETPAPVADAPATAPVVEEIKEKAVEAVKEVATEAVESVKEVVTKAVEVPAGH